MSFDVTSLLHTRDNPERLREHSQGEGMDERPLPVTAMATLALDGTSDGDSGMWGTAPPEGPARAPALLAFLLAPRSLCRNERILARHYRLHCKRRPTRRAQGRAGQRDTDTGRDGVHGWLRAGRGGAVIQPDSCASPLLPRASPPPHRRCHITLHSLPSTHTAPGRSPSSPAARTIVTCSPTTPPSWASSTASSSHQLHHFNAGISCSLDAHLSIFLFLSFFLFLSPTL